MEPKYMSMKKKQEIERPPSIQGMGTLVEQYLSKEDKQKIEDQLFEASMKHKWVTVLDLYGKHDFVHEAKLTKSEDTILHIAICTYHEDGDDSKNHLICIQKLVNIIKSKDRPTSLRILQLKNEKGNTPLHLAAELGSVEICSYIVKSSSPELIRNRNKNGETPLFLAAHRGKLHAFLYLHKQYTTEDKTKRNELCRRGNGDNILHSAISGEYFELAYQIIAYYEELVNYYNVEGMSPLHILARKPQVFKSCIHFRLIDSIIYYSTTVEKLRKKYVPEKTENISGAIFDIKVPENYQTFLDFLELIRDGMARSIAAVGKPSFLKKKEEQGTLSSATTEEHVTGKRLPGDQIDLENPPNKELKSQASHKYNSQRTISGVIDPQTEEDKNPQGDDETRSRIFPVNYLTFTRFLRFLMKVILIVLGIGLRRIEKLQEKRKKHTWAVQIMKKMIKKEARYKYYDNTGETPQNTDVMHKDIGAPPLKPPNVEEDNEDVQMLQPSISNTENKEKDDAMSVSKNTKETPLLAAAKMGILEMVEKILERYPIAIQDTDIDDKNILLLAVENRQTNVYDWLIGRKFPEFVYYQVDKQGNSAVHLAAMFHGHELWRIPGAALQMQGEVKWYKYVKHSMPPQSYVRYNKKDQIPKEIFRTTHEELTKTGTKWLLTTSNSCSVVAALIATVAFATSVTVPGGAKEDSGLPVLENEPAFNVFSISSLVALCFSVTALVFFLAILTSRCQQRDFRTSLPQKLLLGLTSLFTSITAILVSFCAAHFFVLEDKFKIAAFPIYAVTCLPVTFFAFNQLPLYADLVRSCLRELPLRSYQVFYGSLADEYILSQKQEGKEKTS